MGTKQNRIKFVAYYFCYFGGVSCILPYMNVYLEKDLGFTGSQLGIYTGITGLFPAFLIPAIGYFADKTGRHKTFFLGVLAVQALSVLFFPFEKHALPAVLLGVLMESARFSAMSLADTQTTGFCSQTKSSYGAIRGCGSFGWMLFGFLTGITVRYFGAWSCIFPLSFLIMLPAFLAALTFPKKENLLSSRHKTSASPLRFRDIRLLLGSRSYLLILLLSVQASVTTDTILSYIGNHLAVTLNAGSESLSLHTLFCIIPEIIMMPVASLLLPKLGYKRCYLISCSCLILRFFIYAAAPNALLFMTGSLLQCVTICCHTVVNLSFLKKSVMPSLFNTALTLSFSAAAVGRAVLAFVFGQLYQYAGSYFIFWFVLAMQIPVTIIILRTREFDCPV